MVNRPSTPLRCLRQTRRVVSCGLGLCVSGEPPSFLAVHRLPIIPTTATVLTATLKKKRVRYLKQDRFSVVANPSTLSDPLKDTAGPALNPLLKVINLISVIIAPIIVATINPALKYGLAAIILAFLAWLVWPRSRAAPSSLVAPIGARQVVAPVVADGDGPAE